jgi:hypothetical protein
MHNQPQMKIGITARSNSKAFFDLIRGADTHAG